MLNVKLSSVRFSTLSVHFVCESIVWCENHVYPWICVGVKRLRPIAVMTSLMGSSSFIS